MMEGRWAFHGIITTFGPKLSEKYYLLVILLGWAGTALGCVQQHWPIAWIKYCLVYPTKITSSVGRQLEYYRQIDNAQLDWIKNVVRSIDK